MKRIITITLSLIMLLMVFTGCDLVDGLASDKTEATGTAADSVDESGNIDHIGRTYKTYWFNFKVTAAETIPDYAGFTAADGYKMVDVTIETTNTFGSTIEMYDDDYFIIWGDGDEDSDICFAAIDETMAPGTQRLADKETMSAHYIFEVPENVTNPAIGYLESFEGGDYGDSYLAYIVID